MATRATYTFNKKFATSVTIYKHHDGYPEGAIGFIDQAIKRSVNGSNKAHTLMDRVVIEFLNNNETNMFSSKHAHGDTEYHYDIRFQSDNETILIKILERQGSVCASEWFIGDTIQLKISQYRDASLEECA